MNGYTSLKSIYVLAAQRDKLRCRLGPDATQVTDLDQRIDQLVRDLACWSGTA